MAVIKQRLELEGWTVNRYGGFSDPRIGIQLMISRGDAFFCLRSFGESSPYVDYYAASSIGQHGVIVSAAGGYSNTAGFVTQPGFQSSPKCYVESGDGAGVCHFFVSDDLAMLVTERAGGLYSCLSFGVLPVLSPGSGGQFVTSTESYLSTQKQPLFANAYATFGVRLSHVEWSGWDVGSRTWGALRPSSQGTLVGVPHFHQNGTAYGNVGAVSRAKSLVGGMDGLIPITLFTEYGGGFAPYAELPDVFLVPMDSFDPGAVYELGAHRFLVFPQYAKAFPADRNYPHFNLGIAVLLDSTA
ncbi:hypothetical protein RDI61_27560 [Pseudomonas plecoglossicida]|uniref:hypothetical protein n=1 Tax=Pseudomonas TaxID=286 RepID=UPI001FFC2F1D|nr:MULTISPECIES: hypothetical protein [Pseudomonas putida group]MCK2124079.1 hypothetical protein [Pseudomonas sp. PNPG3]MDQ7967743.1 hypothetical protein [Pseudomonas plecoglossicida]WFG05285.1 hypothetical protein P3X84_11865 [Pseudomonas putida]